MQLFRQEQLNLPKTLSNKYIVPPFSVFNTHQPYFRQRLRMWTDLGVVSKQGREAHLCYDNRRMDKGNNEKSNGTSAFNPVLCEVIYKWFTLPDSLIFDPFAGGITRGVVAAMLGHSYIGYDINEKQIDINWKQYFELSKKYKISGSCSWFNIDSSEKDYIDTYRDSFDLIFTCPPYYNLEKYTDKGCDLSNKPTYEEFLDAYKSCLYKSYFNLKDDSFFVIVVSDIRNNKTGEYYGFVADTIKILQNIGLKYYNDTGNLAITSGNYLDKARKVGRQHQNVLVFYKGNTKSIKEKFGEVN